jgi:hypothetical protein
MKRLFISRYELQLAAVFGVSARRSSRMRAETL